MFAARHSAGRQSFFLFTSGGTEAALAPDGVVQLLLLGELGGEVGGDDQLGNAVAALHGAGFPAVVVQGHHQLAPVVGINDPHLVGGRQPLLGGKARPGVHQAHKALRDGQGQPGVNEHRLAGSHGDGAVGDGIQVRPGRVHAAIGGHLGPGV